MRSLIAPITLLSLLAMSACEETQICTNIGCRANDYQLVREWSPGEYEVDVSYTLGGDVAFACTLHIEEGEDDDAGAFDNREGACTQTEGDPRAVALNVLNGAVTLSIYDAPESFQLDVSRQGESLARDTVTPQYEVSYPNGPKCGECRSATMAIAL